MSTERSRCQYCYAMKKRENPPVLPSTLIFGSSVRQRRLCVDLGGTVVNSMAKSDPSCHQEIENPQKTLTQNR